MDDAVLEPVTDRTPQHGEHDPFAIAQLAADDLRPSERPRVEQLAAECTDCAALLARPPRLADRHGRASRAARRSPIPRFPTHRSRRSAPPQGRLAPPADRTPKPAICVHAAARRRDLDAGPGRTPDQWGRPAVPRHDECAGQRTGSGRDERLRRRGRARGTDRVGDRHRRRQRVHDAGCLRGAGNRRACSRDARADRRVDPQRRPRGRRCAPGTRRVAAGRDDDRLRAPPTIRRRTRGRTRTRSRHRPRFRRRAEGQDQDATAPGPAPEATTAAPADPATSASWLVLLVAGLVLVFIRPIARRLAQ